MVGEAVRSTRDLKAGMAATCCSMDATGIVSKVASTTTSAGISSGGATAGAPMDRAASRGGP